jgi:YD repeat-containing protein
MFAVVAFVVTVVNAKTNDDPKGGNHETGLVSYKGADGKQVNAPSVPGAAGKLSEKGGQESIHVNPQQAADPSQQMPNGTVPDVQSHTHPAGTLTTQDPVPLRPLTSTSTYSGTTRYSYGVTYAPNGDVLTSTDSVNKNWTYSYDQFNRLLGSTLNSPSTTFSYVYDRYGNRWQQNPGGYAGTFNGNNNRIDGLSYDAAGNLLSDGAGGNHYTYDAENRIITYSNSAGGTASYVYDALGQRVENAITKRVLITLALATTLPP